MKHRNSYIDIYEYNSKNIIEVKTWELKDFIEDYLSDSYDLSYDFFEELNPELRETNYESYRLYFSKSIELEFLKEIINKLDKNEIKQIVEFQQIQAWGKFYCPCCGYNTLDEAPNGTYNICDICFWEDDPVQLENPNYEGGANRVSLIQGRKNFDEFGASELEMIKNVRKPTKKDIINPVFRKKY